MSMQHAQDMLLSSSGGKFQLVLNFTQLHALTVAARSCALLRKINAQHWLELSTLFVLQSDNICIVGVAL